MTIVLLIAIILVGLVGIRMAHRLNKSRYPGAGFVTFKGVKDNGTPEKRKKAIQARQAARNALVKQMVPRGTVKK